MLALLLILLALVAFGFGFTVKWLFFIALALLVAGFVSGSTGGWGRRY